MEELISVVVPVYNKKEYLRKCIDSILAQTYTYLEVILVDDGSTDGSSEIVDEYELHDKRVRVVHKENGGLSSARNRGIKEARGKYVGFVDADDYIEKDMYANLCKAYKDYPDEPIFEATEKMEEPVCIAVLPDHPTPVEMRIHVNEPVPFIIYDKDTRYEIKDGAYGLANCAATVAKILGIEPPSMWEESMI